MLDPVLSSQHVFTCLLLLTILTDKMLLLIPLLQLKKLGHKLNLGQITEFVQGTQEWTTI